MEWSKWVNKTKCITNNGKTCGKGTISRARNCTANNTNIPSNKEECLKRYPAERSTIDCFVDCYGNVFYFYVSIF